MSEFTVDQSNLAELMSQISEEQYCAGWMSGLEYALWAFINSEGDFHYGLFSIPDHYRAELREASNKCGGWIVWKYDQCETFLTLDEWKGYVAKAEGGQR